MGVFFKFLAFVEVVVAKESRYNAKLTRAYYTGRITEPLSKEATLALGEMMPDCTGMFIFVIRSQTGEKTWTLSQGARYSLAIP